MQYTPAHADQRSPKQSDIGDSIVGCTIPHRSCTWKWHQRYVGGHLGAHREGATLSWTWAVLRAMKRSKTGRTLRSKTPAYISQWTHEARQCGCPYLQAPCNGRDRRQPVAKWSESICGDMPCRSAYKLIPLVARAVLHHNQLVSSTSHVICGQNCQFQLTVLHAKNAVSA